MCPGPLIGMKNLPQIRLIHNLVVFHNFGNQLRDAEEDKTEENRVKGCQATVWLKSQTDDQSPPCLSFVADSNSQIVKRLVYILHLMFSGKSISEIIAYDEKAIFSRLGLDRHLSPTRSTGLNAMVQQIKAQARSAG